MLVEQHDHPAVANGFGKKEEMSNHGRVASGEGWLSAEGKGRWRITYGRSFQQ